MIVAASNHMQNLTIFITPPEPRKAWALNRRFAKAKRYWNEYIIVVLLLLILGPFNMQQAYAQCTSGEGAATGGASANSQNRPTLILTWVEGRSSATFQSELLTAIRNLDRTNGGLLGSLSTRNAKDLQAVTELYRGLNSDVDAFFIFDSEFMNRGEPTYNQLLSVYSHAKFSATATMIVEPFPPVAGKVMLAQLSPRIDASSASLLIEGLAAMIAHPELTASVEFRRYLLQVVSDGKRGEVSAATKENRETFASKCFE